MYRNRRHVVLASVLFGLLLLGACSEAPTSPEFRYAGTWTGFWKDTPALFMHGLPDGSDFTLNIASDGSASASGSKDEVFADGRRSCSIQLTLMVMPDGAVYGTGKMSSSLTPVFGYSGRGEVIGQLDARTGRGSGNLIVDLNGMIWHFPWQVERE